MALDEIEIAYGKAKEKTKAKPADASTEIIKVIPAIIGFGVLSQLIGKIK